MKKQDFIWDNYTLVDTRMANGITVNIYKANCIASIPKELVEYIVLTTPVVGCVKSNHNYDCGIFDAAYVEEKRSNTANVYISAILRRPFTEEQRKKYELICSKRNRLRYMYDSKND